MASYQGAILFFAFFVRTYPQGIYIALDAVSYCVFLGVSLVLAPGGNCNPKTPDAFAPVHPTVEPAAYRMRIP